MTENGSRDERKSMSFSDTKDMPAFLPNFKVTHTQSPSQEKLKRRRGNSLPVVLCKPYLCSTVSSFLYTEANEPRVSHFHQNIVNAVNMDAANASLFHVLHNMMNSQSSVQTTVAIFRKVKKGETFQYVKCLHLFLSYLCWALPPTEASYPI